jgi:hypothetical protein
VRSGRSGSIFGETDQGKRPIFAKREKGEKSMSCNECKYAEWQMTAKGIKHPSGDGKCAYPVKMPQLPKSRYWFGGEEPRSPGGYITRRRNTCEGCPCYAPLEGPEGESLDDGKSNLALTWAKRIRDALSFEERPISSNDKHLSFNARIATARENADLLIRFLEKQKENVELTGLGRQEQK